MTDESTTVDTYLSMWNEDDPAERARLIERAWVAGGRYLDPVLEAEGYDALSQMVEGVHAKFPGYRFKRLSGVDRHHDNVRFAWALEGEDGTVAVAGIDIGELAADGRLRAITGFFGELPESAAA
jgi:hypothetical protein